MPRPANPYSPILKRLIALQTKADKINAEIKYVTQLVEAESAKISKPKAFSVAQKRTLLKTTKGKKPTAKAKK